MGHLAEEPKRATYAALEAVPSNKVAEILGGVLGFSRRAIHRGDARLRVEPFEAIELDLRSLGT